MRALAHIEKIEWLRPIDGADMIELAGVLGWQCIVKKGEFRVGDKAIYIEIDSIVPADNPDFAFLESKHYKIKTMKMKGTISQGILFPLSILHNEKRYYIGDDVTKELKIKQIEDEVPKTNSSGQITAIKQKHRKLFKNKFFLWLMKNVYFRKIVYKILAPKTKPKKFPTWIIKTDETRLQNMPNVLEKYKDKPMIVTEKLDGTSTSFGLRKESLGRYDFAICSRNVRQINVKQKCFFEDNVYHKIAKKYDIRSVLGEILENTKANAVVLQGETIGKGIQKNKYKINDIDFYAFNLVIDGVKIDSEIARNIVQKFGIKWVPIISTDFKLLPTVEEMIALADGTSEICGTLREGLVIRDHDNTTSFKCISNKFLLKHQI